jgi:hypothetical protein
MVLAHTQIPNHEQPPSGAHAVSLYLPTFSHLLDSNKLLSVSLSLSLSLHVRSERVQRFAKSRSLRDIIKSIILCFANGCALPRFGE